MWNHSRPTDIGDARTRLATQYVTQDAEADGKGNTEQARDHSTIVSTKVS
jgi:hypothetical protein